MTCTCETDANCDVTEPGLTLAHIFDYSKGYADG